ncbi:MAG: hypothetical protein EBY22_17065, partial [Gammaproteobacteria bacterium]|nr:hypothetical protein [Gammaproteobacteria bacterium]
VVAPSYWNLIFGSLLSIPKKRKKKITLAFLRSGWIKSLTLLVLLPFTSSLQAANESVTIGHDVGIRDVSGSQLLTNSIIRVGVFNNATNTNNPLTTTEIASLLNGTQTEVRNNLNALFATSKATYWGNTTVKSLFNTNTLVKLTKTSTPVFATNVIYTLVFKFVSPSSEAVSTKQYPVHS